MEDCLRWTFDGQVKPWHNKGYHEHFADIRFYGPTHYAVKNCQYWCPCEEQEKCKSAVKAELKYQS